MSYRLKKVRRRSSPSPFQAWSTNALERRIRGLRKLPRLHHIISLLGPGSTQRSRLTSRHRIRWTPHSHVSGNMSFPNHDAFGRSEPSHCRGNWRMQTEGFADKAIEMIQALDFLVRYITRVDMECDLLAQLR